MKPLTKRLLSIFLTVLFLLSAVGCSTAYPVSTAAPAATAELPLLTDPPASAETPAPAGTPVPTEAVEETPAPQETELPAISEDGTYTTKDDVALYLFTYGCLPGNFITKAEAQKLGWSGGSLERYAPGCCIGGDKFGNREGLLPTAKGRQYYECDINTLGASSRGAERIVFSGDGLIYYTGDHYASYELLYDRGGELK